MNINQLILPRNNKIENNKISDCIFHNKYLKIQNPLIDPTKRNKNINSKYSSSILNRKHKITSKCKISGFSAFQSQKIFKNSKKPIINQQRNQEYKPVKQHNKPITRTYFKTSFKICALYVCGSVQEERTTINNLPGQKPRNKKPTLPKTFIQDLKPKQIEKLWA